MSARLRRALAGELTGLPSRREQRAGRKCGDHLLGGAVQRQPLLNAARALHRGRDHSADRAQHRGNDRERDQRLDQGEAVGTRAAFS